MGHLRAFRGPKEESMRERPILFSGPMIRAILEGRKTQTRRIVKPQPSDSWHPVVERYCPTIIEKDGMDGPGPEVFGASDEDEGRKFPYGAPGDFIWVREAWCSAHQDGAFGTAYRADNTYLQGKRSHPKGPHYHFPQIGPHVRWRPSIHIPRWASRINLEITGVRVERLHEISEADAIAEGIRTMRDDSGTFVGREGDSSDGRHMVTPWPSARQAYADLWESINGRSSWDCNPWVWVVEFRKV
jgi:hypothetical protein